jgi:hypothetical protein
MFLGTFEPFNLKKAPKTSAVTCPNFSISGDSRHRGRARLWKSPKTRSRSSVLASLETPDRSLPEDIVGTPVEAKMEQPIEADTEQQNEPINLELISQPEALAERHLLLQLKKQLGPDFERIFDSKNPIIGDVF